MDTIINLRLPHIAEQIFECINDNALIRYRSISKTWKTPVENVLAKRLKKYVKLAFPDIVEPLFEHSNGQRINWNLKIDNDYKVFMWACNNGHSDVVKLLLVHPDSKSTNFNATNDLGRTGFTLACIHGHLGRCC